MAEPVKTICPRHCGRCAVIIRSTVTDREFQQTLSCLGLSLAELAGLLAVNTRTTRRWADDPTEIPGPAEQALRAWVRLQRLGLAWRPDGVAIGERSPERIAEQIKLYLRHALDLDAIIQRVEGRGGPAAPWDVRLVSRQASLGPVVVSFYPLVNGGFSPASYIRRDRAPDLQRDWTLIEDALACVAKAVSAAGPDWARRPGEAAFPFSDAAYVPNESARQVLDKSDCLFRETLAKLTDLSEAERAAFAAGAQEIALAIDGTVSEHVANERFLDLVLSANPRFRADWPVWIDTRGFEDSRFRPRVTNKVWQTLFVTAGQSPWDLAEFYRLDPRGRFSLRRMLEDDSFARANNFAVGAYLDPHHVIARTAEAIAVGLAFAQAMQCDPATTRLAFGFRWTKLARRLIHSWTGFGRFLPARQQYISVDDEAEGFVEVPLSTPAGALAPFVECATASLFAQFGGFEVPVGFTNSVVQKLIEKA
jgi:hypothetical protein